MLVQRPALGRRAGPAGRRGLGRPPAFWWFDQDGATAGAASWASPFPAHVSTLARGGTAALARALARRSADIDRPVRGVLGPAVSAHRLAAAWRAFTGRATRVHATELLHALTQVEDVPLPPGRCRPALGGDAETVLAWLRAFSAEVDMPTGASPHSWVDSRIERGLIDVWEVDCSPVAMSGHSQPVTGVVRVGPVYTPPAHRNHGYARRLVAEVSAAALNVEDVHHCVLYTDAANPVSNSIYRQAGYRPIEDHAEIEFG